jgi:hypothetical protein
MNPIHDHLHPSALHPIDAPRRMIQEICCAAQMTVTLCGMLDLSDILSSGTENDTMNESE